MRESRLDVQGIDQQQGELILLQSPDLIPIDAGALHGGVQPAGLSQSASANSSSLIVPKLRTSFVAWPLGPGRIRQATTVRL